MMSGALKKSLVTLLETILNGIDTFAGIGFQLC